jgi:hypothetical protein
MAQATNGTIHGVAITGELIDVTEGKVYTDRNGELHTPGIVNLLVGRYVERIEFNNLEDAQDALQDAPPRATVTLAVRPTGPWDAAERRWGRVNYRGRSE